MAPSVTAINREKQRGRGLAAAPFASPAAPAGQPQRLELRFSALRRSAPIALRTLLELM
jgi:hypothetical protein